MREITYREILDNIDSGLVVFLEDDFVYPPNLEVDEIACRAVRMDEKLREKMLTQLYDINPQLSTDFRGFLNGCDTVFFVIKDWGQIADVTDVLEVCRNELPDQYADLERLYTKLKGNEFESSLSVFFRFGLHCNFAPKYSALFDEYLMVEGKWKPFLIFDSFNSDISTEIEGHIQNLQDPNDVATFIIDNNINGMNRAEEIMDALEKFIQQKSVRIIGAVVTSNEPIERINNSIFIEYVKKDNIEKLKQALLRSSYHYLLSALKTRVAYSINSSFTKAAGHRNIAIYLATMARIEGISNYEVLTQWINAICETSFSDSCGIPKLVAIANMLDACEECPDFENMEGMNDLNMAEAFDYKINRFFLPVAPGDVFQTSDGKVYILVGQSCDMMMGEKRKRRNGICELVQADITSLIWNNKTLENLTHIWINNFYINDSASALKIDYQHRYFLDNELISLCSYNPEGDCFLPLKAGIPESRKRLMQPYQCLYYLELQQYFGAIDRIKNSGVQGELELVLDDSYVSRICKITGYTKTEDTLSFGIKRIARLKTHYYLYLYKMYLEHRGRIPFETINLARLQVINATFYDGTHKLDLDVEVFLARASNTAKTLPWILKKEQVEEILESISPGNTIKDPEHHYLLNGESLRIPLMCRKSLVLTKKSPDRVHCQIS